LHATSFDQHLGLPEGERDAEGNFIRPVAESEQIVERTVTPDELRTYKLFIPNQSVRHFRIASNTNYYQGNSRIQLDLGYQRNIRQEFGNVLDENEEELRFDLHTSTWNFIYHLPSSNRSEEHTSELQSRENLVCRLLLEKKKKRP